MPTPRTSTGVRFASSLSTASDIEKACDEVCQKVSDCLGAPPDLAMLFVSHKHGSDFQPLIERLHGGLKPRQLLGCTGESIVGGAQEIEDDPALSLWAARLPDVSIQTMHLEFTRTSEGGLIAGWPDELLGTWPSHSALLALAEPFTFPADLMLERLNEDRPGIPVLGGMASGGWQPGQNRLFLGEEVYEDGAVAALIHGPVRVRSIVSQGCRPVGRHFVITQAEQNVIHQLSGKPALERLSEVIREMSPEEKQCLQHGLHVGRVINEYQEKFARGDFLIRNVTGVDQQSGAIAIGDFVRPGQTVQFHIRDAQSADEDLRALLASVSAGDDPQARGGLLFTCNGRGTRLFDAPNHDTGVIQEYLKQIPLAGFFAQGEMGPIGGKNFLHGFTASLALFDAEPADAADA